MDLKETDILGLEIGSHWYYRSKANAISRLLFSCPPSIILDVGAGSGFFSKKLLTDTTAKEAWCVDISYESDADTLEVGKPIYFRREVDKVNADLVLLMDVLEHVDDDVGLLKDYVNKVSDGTRFLISVPAFQFLWSGHDVFLEHKRRYRLNQLEEVVRRAGLKVQHSAYYYAAVLPLATVIRLAGNWVTKGKTRSQSQLSSHHPLINWLLAAVSRAEMPLLKWNRLAGLTIFCIAEKCSN